MTGAVNYFLPLLRLTMFVSLRTNSNEVQKANALANEARQILAQADEEARNGSIAQSVMTGNEAASNKKLCRNLAEIAIWHYERSSRKYREAATKFEEVKNLRIQSKFRSHFNQKVNSLTKCAAQAETSIQCLNNFLKQV